MDRWRCVEVVFMGQVAMCRGGLYGQVPMCRGGLYGQVAMCRGGLYGQVALMDRWPLWTGGYV